MAAIPLHSYLADAEIPTLLGGARDRGISRYQSHYDVCVLDPALAINIAGREGGTSILSHLMLIAVVVWHASESFA